MMQLETPGTDQPFRHEAFFYSGPEEFLDRATTFLMDGLEAGEPALVMVDRAKIDDLRTALNGDADRVFFADMGVVGENPARIIPAWQGFVNRHAGSAKALRGIGEPIWPGRTRAELDECHFHESLLNVAFGTGSPFWRPAMRETSTSTGRTRCRQIRAVTERTLKGIGLSRDRTFDFVLAVSELATNSLMHGGGTGTLRFWFDDTHVVAEMRDAGHITDALVGRVTPIPTAQSGRGLWITNQLCELVQIRSAGTGTVIRAHMRRR